MKIHYSAAIAAGDIRLIGVAECGAGKGRSQFGVDATSDVAKVDCARCLKRIGKAADEALAEADVVELLATAAEEITADRVRVAAAALLVELGEVPTPEQVRHAHRRVHFATDGTPAQWREHVAHCVRCALRDVEVARARVEKISPYSRGVPAARRLLAAAEAVLGRALDGIDVIATA
jgi:hypothetical protein